MLPPTRTGAAGGGGGGGGGVGRMSAAINGMMTTAPMITVWTMIDSGTVYHFWLPTVMDGLTTSPNMSRGTVELLLHGAERQQRKRRPIIVVSKTESQRA